MALADCDDRMRTVCFHFDTIEEYLYFKTNLQRDFGIGENIYPNLAQ